MTRASLAESRRRATDLARTHIYDGGLSLLSSFKSADSAGVSITSADSSEPRRVCSTAKRIDSSQKQNVASVAIAIFTPIDFAMWGTFRFGRCGRFEWRRRGPSQSSRQHRKALHFSSMASSLNSYAGTRRKRFCDARSTAITHWSIIKATLSKVLTLVRSFFRAPVSPVSKWCPKPTWAS